MIVNCAMTLVWNAQDQLSQNALLASLFVISSQTPVLVSLPTSLTSTMSVSNVTQLVLTANLDYPLIAQHVTLLFIDLHLRYLIQHSNAHVPKDIS